MRDLGEGKLEIYNEFSLQHELGFFLRSRVSQSMKVQFERPATFFGIDRTNLIKKEIDISVFSETRETKHAFELKYPRNGQHPEQMFKACQDIAFLEQLAASGFGVSYLVMVVDDRLFYEGPKTDGIYAFFRGGVPLTGQVMKPTGIRNQSVNLRMKYQIVWRRIGKGRRFSLVRVGDETA